MTMPELVKKMDELQIPLPPKPTRGLLQRIIRDSTRDLSEQIVTFGRHKNLLFRELPHSYIRWRWSLQETAAQGSGASHELRQLANFAQKVLNPQKETYHDPEMNAAIPYQPDPEETSSISTKWSLVTGTSEAMASGYNQGKNHVPTAKQMGAKPASNPRRARWPKTLPGGTRGTRGTNHQDRPAQGEAWNVILSLV